jgi:hypothetical protein
MRLALVLLLAFAVAGFAEDAARERRAAERFWELLSLPYVRSIPEVRAMRRALIGAFFPRWPYRDGRDGWLVVEPWFRRDPRLRLFSGRVGIEGGIGGHPETAADADIDSTFRLGAQLRLQRHWRSSRVDDSGTAASTWRLFESRGSRLRAAFGLRWYRDRDDAGVGPLGGLALDLFPRRPWALAVDTDLGTVGGHVVAAGSAAAGLLERAVEVRAGLRLQSGWPSFHGPFIGLRWWF